jgi:hypothetical protein
MSSSRRSSPLSAPLRRPAGPRCHGGASSLLRLGFGAVPQRIATARASGWCETSHSGSAGIEHIVGMPRCAERPAPLWS